MKPVASMSPEELLDELAGLRVAIQTMSGEMEALINGKIPPDILKEIQDIKAEFTGKLALAAAREKALEDEIKAQIKIFDETRAGKVLQATYTIVHGFDHDKLRVYKLRHPDIAICETITEKVTIEKVKESKTDKGNHDAKKKEK